MKTYDIYICDKNPFLYAPPEMNYMYFSNISYRQLLDFEELCESEKKFLILDFSEEE